MKKILITGVNSDIGTAFAIELKKMGGYEIVGTYRKKNHNTIELNNNNVHLKQVDFSNTDHIEKWLESIDFSQFSAIYFIHGVLNPIGKLGDIDIIEWEFAYQVNFLSIVKILNFSLNKLKNNCRIVTLAGGGVNGAPKNFSSYTSAKVSLVKLTELCAAEYPELLFFNIGPGWVDTQIHQQTLKCGNAAGDAFEETKRRYDENDFVEIVKVTDALKFFLEDATIDFSGRNYSVSSGELLNKNLKLRLKSNNDLFKLRRFEK